MNALPFCVVDSFQKWTQTLAVSNVRDIVLFSSLLEI